MIQDMCIDGRPVIVFNSEGCYTFNFVEDETLPDEFLEIERVMRAVNLKYEYPVLLLEGGSDIDPEIYGQKNTYSHVSPFSQRRDRKEIFQYNLARELGWAIFGICRGHQLMAALNGGTLHQDINVAGYHNHRGGNVVLKYQPLIDWAQSETYYVNSMHHQAINRLPENCLLTASAFDGIVEAVVYTDFQGISYQWHPEFMSDRKLVEWSLQHLWEKECERQNNIRSGDRNTESTAELHQLR